MIERHITGAECLHRIRPDVLRLEQATRLTACRCRTRPRGSRTGINAQYRFAIYQNVRKQAPIYYLADAGYEPGKIYVGTSRRIVSGQDPRGFLRAFHSMTGDLV